MSHQRDCDRVVTHVVRVLAHTPWSILVHPLRLRPYACIAPYMLKPHLFRKGCVIQIEGFGQSLGFHLRGSAQANSRQSVDIRMNRGWSPSDTPSSVLLSHQQLARMNKHRDRIFRGREPSIATDWHRLFPELLGTQFYLQPVPSFWLLLTPPCSRRVHCGKRPH